MKFDFKMLLAVAGAALLMNGSWADVAPPRAVVTVFFAKDEQPYHYPVDFQVQCYGRSYSPYYVAQLEKKGRKPPFEEVYQYSGSCPDYGCTVNLARSKPNYTTIDYCNLTGKTEGRSFKVEKFGVSPVGECTPDDNYFATDLATTGRWTVNCKLNLTLPK